MATTKPSKKSAVIITPKRLEVLAAMKRGRVLIHDSAVLAAPESYHWLDTGEKVHRAVVGPLVGKYIWYHPTIYRRMIITPFGEAVLKDIAQT